MRFVLLALALAGCGSSSPSGANPDAHVECTVSGVVNGSLLSSGPTPPKTFGTVIAVETWDSDTSGSVVRHLTIADDTWKLHLDGASMGVSMLEGLVGGDGDPQPPGTATFTRTGEPCAEGTFEAEFDNGVLSGMYRGPYLGLNPPGH
jgi:hypothetical protein